MVAAARCARPGDARDRGVVVRDHHWTRNSLFMGATCRAAISQRLRTRCSLSERSRVTRRHRMSLTNRRSPSAMMSSTILIWSLRRIASRMRPRSPEPVSIALLILMRPR
jgi:hypothetical protein